jgi:nucleoside 2-deoxyribosyltransferase
LVSEQADRKLERGEMKIYVAHNFAARNELARKALAMLDRMGHEVTSRWITDDTHTASSEDQNRKSAMADLEDIDRADAILLFVDQVGSTPGRGKWVEFGYAYAKGKRCYLYGVCTQCIFIHLPGVYRILSFDEIEAGVAA